MGNQPCFPDIRQDNFFYAHNTFEMREESQIQELNRNADDPSTPNAERRNYLKKGRGRPTKGPYVCFSCDEVFNYKAPFSKHLKEAHNISPEKVPRTPKKVLPTTKIVEKKFESKTPNEFQFEDNLKIKEEVIEDEGTTSKTVAEPTRDLMTRRRQSEGPYVCSRCSDTFELRACFLKHQREDCVITPSKKRTVKGETKVGACFTPKITAHTLPKTSGYAHLLKVNESTQKTEPKKYLTIPKTPPALVLTSPVLKKTNQCKKCDRIYDNPKSFWRHTTYECEVEPRFTCNDCGLKFKRKYHLKRHRASQHFEF
ncbi:zinc finger protein 888-like [Belonocnema kinseyi]|uniref:zinc finger protein 888-like n=1 Tax=Belonocnema kinseyi TaxID=2817044 RepID=UPI00143D51DE|nr:zinc finger protein 888-like [Belonocnema kinseyi]